MIAVLYIVCSIFPIIGHLILGFFVGWASISFVALMQILTFVPIIGPIVAFYSFGFFEGVVVTIGQIVIMNK